MINHGGDADPAWKIPIHTYNLAFAMDANALRHRDFRRQGKGEFDGSILRYLRIEVDVNTPGTDIFCHRDDFSGLGLPHDLHR